MKILQIRYTTLLVLSLLMFLTINSFSQTTIHSIGFDIGTMGGQTIKTGSGIMLFPEIFISGNFVSSNFNWKFNFGYWDDFIDKRIYSDSPTFSFSSIVLGAELLYLLPKPTLNHPSPVRFLTGLSYHLINAKVISDGGQSVDYVDKFPVNLFYFNGGVELHVSLYNKLSLFIKGLGFVLLNNRDVFDEFRFRTQYSIGLNYIFEP